jgi:hypothetical protein
MTIYGCSLVYHRRCFRVVSSHLKVFLTTCSEFEPFADFSSVVVGSGEIGDTAIS